MAQAAVEYEPGVGIRYGAMLQSLLKRRFGEHNETDLAWKMESSERDISKYEQQSSDLISDAIKHEIVCGGMAHQGLKQHVDLSMSGLVTYKALRDEIINCSRARRTWTGPNAMQVDAVHVGVGQGRQGGRGNGQPDKGKGGNGGRLAGLKANAGTARRRSTRGWSAGRCKLILWQADATRVANQSVSTRSRLQGRNLVTHVSVWAPASRRSRMENRSERDRCLLPRSARELNAFFKKWIQQEWLLRDQLRQGCLFL